NTARPTGFLAPDGELRHSAPKAEMGQGEPNSLGRLRRSATTDRLRGQNPTADSRPARQVWEIRRTGTDASQRQPPAPRPTPSARSGPIHAGRDIWASRSLKFERTKGAA